VTQESLFKLRHHAILAGPEVPEAFVDRIEAWMRSRRWKSVTVSLYMTLDGAVSVTASLKRKPASGRQVIFDAVMLVTDDPEEIAERCRVLRALGDPRAMAASRGIRYADARAVRGMLTLGVKREAARARR
jgi:hypothetical protein